MKKIITTISLLLFAQNSFAQNPATNAKKLDLQMINSLSQMEGDAFGSKNHKQVFNSFIELPVSKKMSFGGTIQASKIESHHNDGTNAYALNSVEIFNRYKVFGDRKFAITMQNSYKFPGVYNENKYLGLMPKQSDYELRFLLAHNMPNRLVDSVVENETPYFVRAEIAYRRRFSNPFDEFRFRLWTGIKINQTFSFLLQDDIGWNVNAKATPTDNSYSNLANFQPSKNANNMLNLSILYHVDRSTAIQFGYIKRLSGNNPFFDNRGLQVGLWTSF